MEYAIQYVKARAKDFTKWPFGECTLNCVGVVVLIAGFVSPQLLATQWYEMAIAVYAVIAVWYVIKSWAESNKWFLVFTALWALIALEMIFLRHRSFPF